MKKVLLIGGVVAAGLLVSSVAFGRRRKLKKAKGISEAQAVDQAFFVLGDAAHPYALTDFAYSLSYPDCPVKLDPENNAHKECIVWWLGLLEKVKDRQGIEIVAPVPAEDTDTISEDLLVFLASLTPEQFDSLRDLVGSEQFDALLAAAEANNDALVRALIYALRQSTEELIKDNPLAAWQLHSQLQDVLGKEKLDSFLVIVA